MVVNGVNGDLHGKMSCVRVSKKPRRPLTVLPEIETAPIAKCNLQVTFLKQT